MSEVGTSSPSKRKGRFSTRNPT
jgi:hypothetical protein